MKPIQLKLYVAGRNIKSEQIIAHIEKLCEQYFSGRYVLTLVDVLEEPSLAEKGHIMATPTLVREAPLPRRLIIGDFSDYDKVLKALDISMDE